jgi:hypothetical protein
MRIKGCYGLWPCRRVGRMHHVERGKRATRPAEGTPLKEPDNKSRLVQRPGRLEPDFCGFIGIWQDQNLSPSSGPFGG